MIELRRNQFSSRAFQWRNNPAIHKWTRQNGLLCPEKHSEYHVKLVSDPSLVFFGIWDVQEHAECVGQCGFSSYRPEHGSAEFSCLIGPEHQRKGYGRKALELLFAYGFKHLRLHRIWGETFMGNPAIKLFQHLGMKTEGVMRDAYFKNGEYTDAFIVSILEDEARKQSWWNG